MHSLQFAFGTHFFRNMVFEDSNWDFRKFKLDDDVKLADTKMAAILNATDPDLRRFRKRGGKLIMYHGWSDAAISPANSIDYYESVVARMGGESKDFIRLFMVPGIATLLHGTRAEFFRAVSEQPGWRRRARCFERGGAVGRRGRGPGKDHSYEI